jgi:uncharacterized protein YyaL (SSP411 family)
MSNRLAKENSPYLLQHAENLVDWFAWGPEALERARREQKPIFLSIGYAACHWCHVMAHESFEDHHISRLLNEHFVNIKVDREERPDLDQIYMEAVMAMTGHGGWPMSVFLTPSLEPFYGGTYWPPRSRQGMPGFDEVVQAVADTWNSRRSEAMAQGQRLAEILRQSLAVEDRAEPASGELTERPLAAAETSLLRTFDGQWGGFGAAPKFPPPIQLRGLLRRWYRHRQDPVLEMVRVTLDRMAAGGIYDHLGGGFHRYSVDQRWLVPHFEKMLYDNAMLTLAHVEAWQITHKSGYARVVRETLNYVLRDMTDVQGGFYSSEDADSEGGEGAFYLWTPDEIRRALGDQKAETFNRFYDVTDKGNFEGRNILNRPKTVDQMAKILGRDPRELYDELADSRQKLLAVRERRHRPARDDKVLVNWNGLMIEALARAGAALGESRYVDAAARAADFLLTHARDARGRLLHYWRAGEARVDAFLDDYASLANALVSLYEASFDPRWIEEAVRLANEIQVRFADAAHGGFFYTPDDSPEIIARRKDAFDSSIPSAAGLATTALLRLGRLCAREDYVAAARESLRSSMPEIDRATGAAGQMLLALDAWLGPAPEIVILGSPDDSADADVLAQLHRRFVPNCVVAYRRIDEPEATRGPSLAAAFRNKEPKPPGPTLFVCQNYTCREPVTGHAAALAALERLAGE